MGINYEIKCFCFCPELDSGTINYNKNFCGKIISSFLDILNFELLVRHPSGKIYDSYLNMPLKFNSILRRSVCSD